MFSKTPKTAPKSGGTPTLISTETKILGNISCAGEVQIDGEVCGDIRCEILLVGAKGAVTGEIIAADARIHGTVTGQIKARKVFLSKSARMMGDITHETLAIEPGAFLQGHCCRLQDGEDLSPAARPRTAPAEGNPGKQRPLAIAAKTAEASKAEVHKLELVKEDS